MNHKRIISQSLVIGCVLILLAEQAVGQSPNRTQTVSVSQSFLREAEKAIAERDHLQTVIKLKDEQIAAKDAQIGALNGFVEIQRQQVSEWAKAALERKDAIKFDDKAAQLQQQEILRVREERDSARRNQKWWGISGVLIGITIGILSQQN